jgi:hypothetical protein
LAPKAVAGVDKRLPDIAAAVNLAHLPTQAKSIACASISI